MGRKKLAQNEDGRGSKKVEELFKESIEEYEKDTIEFLRNFTRNQRSRMGRKSWTTINVENVEMTSTQEMWNMKS